LREAAVALFEAERDLATPDEELVPRRKLLSECYDAYVSRCGPIHRARITHGPPDPETGEQTIRRVPPPALVQFRQDPDYTIVLGLEIYDEETQEASRAEIFFQRIHRRPVRPTVTEEVGEALALCLDECGKLDLA